jgi:uncharacterized membrane protein YkvA (DUF1232 family)
VFTATCAACWLVFVVLLIGFRGRLNTNARDVVRFLPDCLVLFKRLLGDRRVGRRVKILLGLLLVYLAMPFDLVPDFIPVIGQLDDLLLIMLVIGYVVKRSGEDVVRELWPGSDRGLHIVLRLAG